MQNVFQSSLASIKTEDNFIKNMIFLLTLTPGGLTKDEVKQLCAIHKEWFGDYCAV